MTPLIQPEPADQINPLRLRVFACVLEQSGNPAESGEIQIKSVSVCAHPRLNNKPSTRSYNMPTLVPVERIASKIYLIRGIKVMLDRDLAELYGVETRTLNQAVSRNIERFPEDFMLSLTRKEIMGISQIVISSKIKFSKRVRCFTEQGVAMLSSVLRSKRAIRVNIQIMRAFTQLRQMLSTHGDLKRKLESMEKKYDKQFKIVFEAIKQLLEADEKPKKKIGFTVKEKQKAYGKKVK